jgi:hypothetical protein
LENEIIGKRHRRQNQQGMKFIIEYKCTL